MKKLFIAGITGVLILWAGTSSRAGDRFGYLQQRQLRQIANGMRTGQITDREFKHLSKEQARIKKARKKATEKGGYNFKSRNYLDTMQKRADVSIYTAVNNGRTIFTRGRISGVPTYGTTRPYGNGRSYRSANRCKPRAVNLPSRYSGRARGGYGGSGSGVRASVRW